MPATLNYSIRSFVSSFSSALDFFIRSASKRVAGATARTKFITALKLSVQMRIALHAQSLLILISTSTPPYSFWDFSQYNTSLLILAGVLPFTPIISLNSSSRAKNALPAFWSSLTSFFAEFDFDFHNDSFNISDWGYSHKKADTKISAF